MASEFLEFKRAILQDVIALEVKIDRLIAEGCRMENKLLAPLILTQSGMEKAAEEIVTLVYYTQHFGGDMTIRPERERAVLSILQKHAGREK